MFEHSVKVPRHFKIASNIVKKVSTEGGSVKTLLYDDKIKHFRTNVLFALVTETIKHASDINTIIENSGILAKEPRLDPWLAKVLTAELLFGKKALPGKSKPEQTILSYKDQFEKIKNENPDDLQIKVVPRPRYVRINTNLLTTSDAIRAFQDEGYKFIRCTSGSYDDYLKQIQSLTEYDFTQDYHVKTVFVFAPSTKLHEHELYLSNQIILQDKATTLAVHFLAPPPGSVVLDMCAAPGMKTTQLAAYLRNQGKIYAVERNERRYGTLCDFVKITDSKCVETIHKDALEIKRGDFDDVEYILLDPSCSGSGMELSVHNYIEEARLAKLTSLQEKFLKHAMNAFPKAKRIVYSTCSMYPEENERVVTNVVKTSRAKWRVQDVKEILKGQWNNFGSGMYGSMGTRCLYAKPESDMTTGFFLAVLDREHRDSDKNKTEKKESLDDEVKNKNNSNDVVDTEITSAHAHNNADVKVKKKKKKERSSDIIESSPEIQEIDQENLQMKKKKKKDKSPDIIESSPEIQEIDPENLQMKKKKKKDKSPDIIESSPEIQEIDPENLQMNKKKKKEKSSDIIESSPEIPEIDPENLQMKKKKKKDKSSDIIENSPEIPEKEPENLQVKKKKEKSSDIIENSPEIPEIDPENLQDDNIETKKKKKRKRNKSTDDDNLAVVNDLQNLDAEEPQFDGAEEISLKKKKKKKNKNKDEVINEFDNSAINCLEDISVDTTIESKNKRKKKDCQQDIESVDDIPKKKKHRKE